MKTGALFSLATRSKMLLNIIEEKKRKNIKKIGQIDKYSTSRWRTRKL